MSSWIFEKVTHEKLGIFAGKTLKPGVYEFNESGNHTKEKGEGKEEIGGQKRLKKTGHLKLLHCQLLSNKIQLTVH